MVKINGSSFALQYKRTTYRPIDSSSVFDTIEDARVYARNTDTEAYFPYAGPGAIWCTPPGRRG